MGTNETVFNRIFATESFPQLRLIFENYYRQTGHDIDKAIKTEMSGDVERAFLAVANVAKNPAGYWATRIYESMIVHTNFLTKNEFYLNILFFCNRELVRTIVI
jgi:annexin A7/11